MKVKSDNKITYSLLQLQNLVKRDPQSYYEEFQAQYQHFESVLNLFKFNPAENDENFADLVRFLSQVSHCYKEDLKTFPDELMNLLRDNTTVLDPYIRLCLVKALIQMRNKDVLKPIESLTFFFDLLRCKDKILRNYIQVHIVSDIKNLNEKHKNLKVNSVLQNFMYKMLAVKDKTAAKVSLDIMIELYRRNVWRDEKTVNAIATLCLSKENKLLVAAIKFFLGIDEDDEEKESDSENDDDIPSVREVMAANKVNKNTRKRKKLLERTKKVLKKSKKKKTKPTFNFTAIHLLHDPLGLAEKLYDRLQRTNEIYEIKLMLLNFISRLIGVHELQVLNFYPFLLRFLKPHQRDVTKILMFAAQAVHEYVPPDSVQLVVKEILNNFVSETNSSEVITVGINAIREICIRCPLAIDKYLLHDLTLYKKYKNKNVQMAARSLIQLFRKINPLMLHRKDRSRPTEATKHLKTKNYEYGALNAKSYVPGTEVLSIDPSTDNTTVEKIEDEDDDSDGSWIDVSHSEDDLSSADEETEDDVKSEESKDLKEDVEDTNENDKTVNSPSGNLDGNQSDAQDNESTAKVSEEFKTEEDKAEAISSTRILSQEDFQKIKVAQIANEVKFAKGKKRKSDTVLTEPDIKRSEIVSLKDIEKLHKNLKSDKEARLATVLEGREGREKFSKKKKRKNPHASKSQKQHNKNKAFMMIKHKVRAKVKRSFKDKQMALRNALLKRKKKQR